MVVQHINFTHKVKYCGVVLFKIAGSIKQNPLTASANQKDVESCVANWLSGARDRGGRKKARLRSTTSANVNNDDE